MATDKMTVTLATDVVGNGEVASLAELAGLTTDSSYGDITQSHFKQSVCTPIAIGPVAPSNPFAGLHWLDTSLSRWELKFYTGSAWKSVSYERLAAAPTSPVDGDLWYDTTLRLLRTYKTEDDLTGWHPVSEGYQLRYNDGAQPITAEQVVSWISPVGSKRPCSQSGGVPKLTNVLGVALEDIAAAASGVIAMVGSQAVVEVSVDTSTHSVAAGDWLVTSGTAGVARSAGGLVTNPYVSAGKRSFGVPLGAFAVAAEANTSGSTATVKARMIDQLGTGMHVLFPAKQIIALGDTIPGGDLLDATNSIDGTSRDVDLADTPRSGGTVLESDKHDPIAGALVTIQAAVNGGAAELAEFYAEGHYVSISGETPGADLTGSLVSVFAVTDDGSGAMGNLLAVKGSTSTAAVPNTYDVYVDGYVC